MLCIIGWLLLATLLVVLSVVALYVVDERRRARLTPSELQREDEARYW